MSCQKCGCSVVTEHYHYSCEMKYAEHIHNRCVNCGYEWFSPTKDEFEKMIKEMKGLLDANDKTGPDTAIL